MVVIIPKDAPPSTLADAMETIAEERATRKGFDAKKYAGKIKCPVDGLSYRKMVRDE